MSLFVCSKCKCIENTALCGYWWRGNEKPLCSNCDPRFKKWHGFFPREKFNSKKWEYYDEQYVRRITNKKLTI